MHKVLLSAVLAVVVSACSDTPNPTSPLEDAPTVRMSHVGSVPGSFTTSDLCGGLSPCDAFDYDRDGDGFGEGIVGVPGFCFLPATVDNHLSDPACAIDFIPDLDGVFQLAWCQVQYPEVDGVLDGTQAPTIVECQDEADWQPLVRDADGGEFYAASVQFMRRDRDNVYRLYVVGSDLHWAHRDVIVNPNLTFPADDFLHSIGTGNERVKVRIGRDDSCVKYDTQLGSDENAATCLIAGETSISFATNEVSATFNFFESPQTFLAEFEVSECLSLGFSYDEASGQATGNALVDTPLADCMISVSSDQVDRLEVPAELQISVKDPRWIGEGGAFVDGRINVIWNDEEGTGVLPRRDAPTWFGEATSSNVVFRWLDRGLKGLASLLGPEPLRAYPSGSFAWERMSSGQVALMAIKQPHESMVGVACANGLPSCLDLGTVGGANPVVPVAVHVTAPTALLDPQYPDRDDPTGDPFDVPGARLHFFPENGSVSCPTPAVDGQVCVEPGQDDDSTTPASRWPTHLVVVTGTTGQAVVEWSLDGGDNTLQVSGCGLARPGAFEADPLGEPGIDGVWGTLGDCDDRQAARSDASAYDNGPADGFTPFEPVDTENEVAIYGLPLTFEARTCPQIVVDGVKGERDGTSEWEACAQKTPFQTNLKGPKGQDNAWLYTYYDGEAVYVGLEVLNDELGNRIFVQLAETYASDGVEAVGDDILIIDFGDEGQSAADWHVSLSCLGNNANSLCGDPDTAADGSASLEAVAQLGGAGSGRAFYEFRRPVDSPNNAGPNKEDLSAVSGKLGLKLTVTQGQGGGKGGFTFPDPQGPIVFHPFLLQ